MYNERLCAKGRQVHLRVEEVATAFASRIPQLPMPPTGLMPLGSRTPKSSKSDAQSRQY